MRTKIRSSSDFYCNVAIGIFFDLFDNGVSLDGLQGRFINKNINNQRIGKTWERRERKGFSFWLDECRCFEPATTYLRDHVKILLKIKQQLTYHYKYHKKTTSTRFC